MILSLFNRYVLKNSKVSPLLVSSISMIMEGDIIVEKLKRQKMLMESNPIRRIYTRYLNTHCPLFPKSRESVLIMYDTENGMKKIYGGFAPSLIFIPHL